MPIHTFLVLAPNTMEDSSMSTRIIIQDIDEATAKWIREEAKRRGVSRETLILALIRRGISMERQRSQLEAYDDLDSLAGTWGDEQATEFLNAIADFEHVDEKLWQYERFSLTLMPTQPSNVMCQMLSRLEVIPI